MNIVNETVAADGVWVALFLTVRVIVPFADFGYVPWFVWIVTVNAWGLGVGFGLGVDVGVEVGLVVADGWVVGVGFAVGIGVCVAVGFGVVVGVGVDVGVIEHPAMTTNVAMQTIRIENDFLFIIRDIFA